MVFHYLNYGFYIEKHPPSHSVFCCCQKTVRRFYMRHAGAMQETVLKRGGTLKAGLPLWVTAKNIQILNFHIYRQICASESG